MTAPSKANTGKSDNLARVMTNPQPGTEPRQLLDLRFDGVAGCLRTPQGGSSRQFLVIKENNSVKTRLLTVMEAAALMGATRYLEPITTDTEPWGMRSPFPFRAIWRKRCFPRSPN
jgi:hypothetical protein